MRRILRHVFEDIKRGENIDLIATIPLIFIIAILGTLGIASPELISSVTLTTLGLLATGLLVTRYKMESIHRAQDIVNSVQLSTKVLSSLTNDLERAKEVWMLGLALRGTVYRHFYSFKQNVSEGTKIRVLIANWDRVDRETTAKRFLRGVATETAVERVRADYEETMDRLKMIQPCANIVGNVQLKLLSFIPPFSLYIFPKAEDGGAIYVETYCYKSPEGSIPKFRVTEHENPTWYKHYTTQFELMWHDAEEFSF